MQLLFLPVANVLEGLLGVPGPCWVSACELAEDIGTKLFPWRLAQSMAQRYSS